MTYLVWGILLVLQNAAFTWVSRARNSGSLSYHAIAAVASNLVWFVAQFILIDKMVQIIRDGALTEAIGTGLFYVLCTVTGSVGMHYVSLRWLETGKRKVGA